MNTSTPKANSTRKIAAKEGSKAASPTPSKVLNPYAMSAQAAAEAVRRAGIVTPKGKLTRIYK